MLAGGRLLSRLSNHQKTVGATCASCCVAVQMEIGCNCSGNMASGQHIHIIQHRQLAANMHC